LSNLQLESKLSSQSSSRTNNSRQEKHILKIQEYMQDIEMKLNSGLDEVSCKIDKLNSRHPAPVPVKNMTNQIQEMQNKFHKDMEAQAQDIAADVTALERKLEMYKVENQQTGVSNSTQSLEKWVKLTNSKFGNIEEVLEIIQSRLNEGVGGGNSDSMGQSEHKPFQVDRADLKILENRLIFEIQMLQDDFGKLNKQMASSEKALESRIRVLEDNKPSIIKTSKVVKKQVSFINVLIL